MVVSILTAIRAFQVIRNVDMNEPNAAEGLATYMILFTLTMMILSYLYA